MRGTGVGSLARGYTTGGVHTAFGENWRCDGTRRGRHGTDGAPEVKGYVHGVS